MDQDYAVREVSLLTLFEHAHEYRCLSGEMPTQDVAVLRFLLAVVHTVFSPVDAEGKRRAFYDLDEALDIYEELWNQKQFPYERFKAYLSEWEDRFYLFHPTHPFWQVPEAKKGTLNNSAKLNGEISESNNKVKLFSNRSREDKKKLSYSEATRWLLHLNAFDDTSAKPKQKGLPSPGAGWLGKLGLIYAEGDNLFETLVLNLVLSNDGQSVWETNKPCWELEKARADERVEIAMPNNQAELLTLQSRRILLMRTDCVVSGYAILGGDFFNKDNAYNEQMTIWRHVSAKGSDPERDTPKRHNSEKQLWREFSSSGDNKTRIPGIVKWVQYLQSMNVGVLNRKEFIQFRAVSLLYGDKDFFATDVYSDQLGFHMQMLSDMNGVWRTMIISMLDISEEVAKKIATLSSDLYLAAGGNAERVNPENAKEQFYFNIDTVFRQWLYDLNPGDKSADIEKSQSEWKQRLKTIAIRQSTEMVAQCGPLAFTGRKNGDWHYSVPEAVNRFRSNLKKVLG